MDRERKLLYVVAILAPMLELLVFFAWPQLDLPQRAVLIGQLNSCRERLADSIENCPAPHVSGKPI